MTVSNTALETVTKVSDFKLVSETLARLKSESKVSNFTTVDEIEIPEIMFHPTSIGHGDLDRGFSELGGLIPSQVVLFTGMPGAGKTTLCAEILSRTSLRYPERPSIFLSYEMSDFQLKLVARKTSGFGKVVIETTVKYSNIDMFLLELEELNPSVLVLDSIQEFAGERPKLQIECVNKFKAFAKKTFIPIILIGHADKGGAYKGPSTLMHNVDTHLKLGISKDTGERLITFGKNRFGGILNPIPFKIESNKVLIGSDIYSAIDEIAGDDDSVNEAFSTFHEKNRNLQYLDWETCKDISKTFIAYMKHAYSEKYPYVIGDLNKATMNFQDKVKHCYCKPSTGAIFMSRHASRVLTSGKLRYGYVKERPYQAEFGIPTKEDEWLWILCHEFAHLIVGMDKHTNSFFKRVLDIARDNQFMFSER